MKKDILLTLRNFWTKDNLEKGMIVLIAKICMISVAYMDAKIDFAGKFCFVKHVSTKINEKTIFFKSIKIIYLF